MLANTGHDDSKLQKYITNAEDKFLIADMLRNGEQISKWRIY